MNFLKLVATQKTINPSRAKIGSIWNFTGAEKVNEKGARIQKIYDKIKKLGFRAFAVTG